MRILKIIVDEKPECCIRCPFTSDKDCGETFTINYNGSSISKQQPDNRCKLVISKAKGK